MIRAMTGDPKGLGLALWCSRKSPIPLWKPTTAWRTPATNVGDRGELVFSLSWARTHRST